MKSKNQTLFLIVIALLVAISVGMTIVNSVVLKNEEVKYIYYYRATKDIPSYTELSADMFEAVPVEETVKLKGMIYSQAGNKSELSGKYNKTPILAGEYMTSDLVQKENTEEKGAIYTIEIVGTFVSDVAYGDKVNIYLLNQKNEVEILFKDKMIYKAKTTAIADAATTETQSTAYEAASKLYIRVSENEMRQYYTSLRDNRIIIVSYNENFAADRVLSDGNLSNQVIDTPNVENTFPYIVIEGDTWESIAYEFDVDIEVLKGVNPSFSTISEGDSINIPE